MRLSELTFAAIDFEGGGATSDAPDLPIQIGIATARLGETPSLFDSFLSINRPVTPSAQRVHGISDQDLIGAPNLPQYFPTLQEHLTGRPLVAHAHGTERRFLSSLPGHRFGPWVDTLQLARRIYPDFSSHKLSHLCDTLTLTPTLTQICPNRTWHDALFDASASLVLLFHLIEVLKLENEDLTMLSPKK